MNNTWYLFVRVENGVPIKLEAMTDSPPTVTQLTKFIGPLGSFDQKSDIEKIFHLIKLLNVDLKENNNKDQKIYLESLKDLVEQSNKIKK